MAKPITISFVATEEIKQQVETVAAQEDRSVSWMIRKFVKEGLKRSTKSQKLVQTSP